MNRTNIKPQQQPLKKFNKKAAPSSAPIVLSPWTKLPTTPDDNQSEFKKFFQVDKRREEIQYYINKAIEWIMNGKFSYQRIKGLNLLLSLVAQFLSAESYSHPHHLEMDKKLFDDIHKNLNPEQNIVIALVHGIFRIANFYQDNLHHNIWILLQEQQPVHLHWIDLRKRSHTANPQPWSIVEPICRLEKKKALMILEGCCLLSHTCSSLIGCMQGIKSLLRILSQQTILVEEEEEGQQRKEQQQHSQVEQFFGAEEEVDWEEVKILAIETLESCIYHTIENAIILCEEGGIEIFASILRNDSLPTPLRTRAAEFLCFLIKLLKDNGNHPLLGSKMIQPIVVGMPPKLGQFLGSKLHDEFDTFYLTVVKMLSTNPTTTNSEARQSLLDLDGSVFDKFIEKIDSLGYSYY